MSNLRTLILSGTVMAMLPMAASAQFVTNRFTGTVTDGVDSPDQFLFYPNGPFGGGDLTGMTFSITTSIDVGSPVGIGNSSSFQGASNYQQGQNYGYVYGTDPYNGYSPMTVDITINGHTLSFNDSTPLANFANVNSDGSVNPNEVQLGSFYWRTCCGYGQQYYGMALDLTSAGGVFGNDFTTPLPSMTSGFGTNSAVFYGANGENVDFNVTGINVPEPSTWALMTLGFLGLGMAAWRKPSALNA